MKLTNELKERIDNYFDTITRKELLEVVRNYEIKTQRWANSEICIVSYYDFDNTIHITGYTNLKEAEPIDRQYDVGYWKIKNKK